MKPLFSKTSGPSPSVQRWQGLLLVCGILCLAFGTWRSFPVVDQEREAKPPLRVLLFDLSAGTTRLRPGHGLWARARLKEQAQAAREEGAELAVGIYGQEVRRLGLAAAEDWLARLMGREGEVLRLELDSGADGASNLAGALALYETELADPARPLARVVICGARDWTGEDPRPRLARLAQAGVAQTWLAPPAATRPDLALEGLRLPKDPAPGEPLVAEFELCLSGASAVLAGPWTLELSVEVERATSLQSKRWSLSLPALAPDDQDVLRWSVRQDLGSTAEGRTGLQARVRLGRSDDDVRGDPIPENDTFAAQTRAGKVKLVAAVGRADQRDNMIAWLAGGPERWPGLQWRILTPSQLPEALGELDLIVSFDLGPNELPATLVEAFVQAGGGWFFCGGWGSLGGWFESGWKASPLTQLLPLIPAPDGGAERDVIFVVDGSGSMAGDPFERVRTALLGLVTSASPEDNLSLRFFTGTLGPSLHLAVDAEGPLAVLRRLMDSRVPGGATSIFYSLERLLEERAALTRAGTGASTVVEREALVFLLTDGKDLDSHGQATRGPLLREGFRQAQTRLIPIAIGEDPSFLFLSYLLAPGESVIDGNAALDLQEVFMREVFEERYRHGNLALVPGKPGALAGTRDLLAAWGSLGEDLPALERYLRCAARPAADVLARGARGAEPVLAWQRVGAGRVAAWASAPLPEWGERYLDGEAWLAPLFRFLAVDPREPQRLRLELERGELLLQEVPEDWPAEVQLTLYAQIPGVGLEHFASSLELGQSLLCVEQRAPAGNPLRTRGGPLPADLRARAQGAPVHGICRDPRNGELLGQVGFGLPCAEEFRSAGRRLVRQEFEPAPDPRRLPLEPQPDPMAWVWLVAGCSLLSLGALLPPSALEGIFARKAAPGPPQA